MIFFENSYSADTRDQIEDRIHRRGQTGEYVLYIDLSGSELDRRIIQELFRKRMPYTEVFFVNSGKRCQNAKMTSDADCRGLGQIRDDRRASSPARPRGGWAALRLLRRYAEEHDDEFVPFVVDEALAALKDAP